MFFSFLLLLVSVSVWFVLKYDLDKGVVGVFLEVVVIFYLNVLFVFDWFYMSNEDVSKLLFFKIWLVICINIVFL